jgi:hypothetical protein
VLSKTEVVWRHLLAATEDGVRRHPSISALAADLGLGVSTVHKALAGPVDVGAVIVRSSGGVRVIDPFKIAVLWAGKRRFDADVVDLYDSAVAASEIEQRIGVAGVVLGGHGAVVARLGRNRIADYDTVIAYAEPERVRRRVPVHDEGITRVFVLEPDPWLARYGRVTPLHQAWVDLFTRPGWQAARFVEALTAHWVTTDAA